MCLAVPVRVVSTNGAEAEIESGGVRRVVSIMLTPEVKVGDYVLLTQGSSARLTPETKSLPIDAVVIGIVDTVHVDTGCVYSRENS